MKADTAFWCVMFCGLALIVAAFALMIAGAG